MLPGVTAGSIEPSGLVDGDGIDLDMRWSTGDRAHDSAANGDVSKRDFSPPSRACLAARARSMALEPAELRVGVKPVAESSTGVTSTGDVTSKTHSGGCGGLAGGAGGSAASGRWRPTRKVSRPGCEEGAGVRMTGEPGLPARRRSSVRVR